MLRVASVYHDFTTSSFATTNLSSPSGAVMPIKEPTLTTVVPISHRISLKIMYVMKTQDLQ